MTAALTAHAARIESVATLAQANGWRTAFYFGNGMPDVIAYRGTLQVHVSVDVLGRVRTLRMFEQASTYADRVLVRDVRHSKGAEVRAILEAESDVVGDVGISDKADSAQRGVIRPVATGAAPEDMAAVLADNSAAPGTDVLGANLEASARRGYHVGAKLAAARDDAFGIRTARTLVPVAGTAVRVAYWPRVGSIVVHFHTDHDADTGRAFSRGVFAGLSQAIGHHMTNARKAGAPGVAGYGCGMSVGTPFVSLRKPVSLAKRATPNTDTAIRSGLVLGAGMGVGILGGTPAPGPVLTIDGYVSTRSIDGGFYSQTIENVEAARREFRGIPTQRLRRILEEMITGADRGPIAPHRRRATRAQLLVMLADARNGTHVRAYDYKVTATKPRHRITSTLTDEGRDFLASHIMFGHIGAGVGVGVTGGDPVAQRAAQRAAQRGDDEQRVYTVWYENADGHHVVSQGTDKRDAVRLYQRLVRVLGDGWGITGAGWTMETLTVDENAEREPVTIEPVPVFVSPHAVCVHINWGTGSYGPEHRLFGSVALATEWFKAQRDEHSMYADVSDACMDVYPACPDCSDWENHHNYPNARYSFGPRGGIVKETV